MVNPSPLGFLGKSIDGRGGHAEDVDVDAVVVSPPDVVNDVTTSSVPWVDLEAGNVKLLGCGVWGEAAEAAEAAECVV